MMEKTVLILGGSKYNIRSIKTSKKAGYYTIVVDKDLYSPGFKYADEYEVIDITDNKKILEYSLTKSIDGIVAINDFGVYTASYVSTHMNLPGLDLEIGKIVTDKARLRKKWEEKSQPNPKFEIVNSLNQCIEAAFNIGFPVILKPAVSRGGSRGVIFVKSLSEIQDAYKFSISFYDDKRILVEEFLNGIEHSAEVLIYNGKGHLLAVSDKIKTPLPARVDKSVIYPTQLIGKQREKLERVVVDAAESLEIENGCAHVECCSLDTGEIKLFEMSARPGGGGTPDPIVSYLTGVNEFEQYLKICVGDSPELLSPLFEKSCVYHFITPEPGIIKKIVGFKEILDWNGILDASLFVEKGDMVKRVRTGSDRSGFIIAGSDNREDAIGLACRAEQNICFYYN